ncbi:MAG: hypothetical protein KME15_24055 [Drouetiella hepatica Uher 2000/2452]|uniref:Uncharacterized protein n=1 Tax=Drouetiella hepatica Uher 2000/2452 TaxID=904376 RepID=A0A951QH93_9CYAN|nr:hypothetical protein [Drouetiella hepatica Uher 2000/2452]
MQKNQLKIGVQKAQEAIYQLLLEVVRTYSPEDILTEFRGLFIHHTDTTSLGALPYLFEIAFSNQESEFRNTLKRSCYILINNWEIKRNYKSIRELIHLFSDTILYKPTISPTLKRLREWLRNFVNSPDFQELKLFAARYEDYEKRHWAERYASYLLVTQYTNLDNPIEQRQAAHHLSRKLKEKFKFDLAMYTALSQCGSGVSRGGRSLKNPTGLGDEALRLIKRVIARRGFFSYPNLANIFLDQSSNLPYFAFKQSLLEYLLFSVENQEITGLLRKHLSETLRNLYTDHNENIADRALLLRTANRLIDSLTLETSESPSPLFGKLLSLGSPIALVMILLKLILICPYARTHLEIRIADLIRYYEKYSEEDCQWVIHFFEVFNVTLTIFTENVEYNLVMMNAATPESSRAGAETYRIFSQARQKT